VTWLEEVVDILGLSAAVVRGRAEEPRIKERLAGADIVVARAVAPLDRLWGWSAPLLRQGGRLLALKGESAQVEVSRDGDAVRRTGGSLPVVTRCGVGLLETPTTIIEVERTAGSREGVRGRPPGRTRKDQAH
jgi:16S rRNA (guanine527-N7)-methyltransferase